MKKLDSKKITKFYFIQEHLRLMRVLAVFNRSKPKFESNIKFWRLLGYIEGKLAAFDEAEKITEQE